MENQVINVEEKKNLIELKHKVFSQRIDRLYNIFIVLSQDSEHLGNIRAIEVIKEQYEKMYDAILEREEFDKYEEVENTIIFKISKIEAELDRHIYRTSKKCEELFDSYIKEIEKYDNYNNLDGELEKIKALKQILKLYKPYISPEQEERIAHKISTIKFEILIRRHIKHMKPNTEIPNVLNQYDTKEEKEIFESLVRQRFKAYMDKEISPDMKAKEIEKKRKQLTVRIMQDVDIRSMILREEIEAEFAKYGKRYFDVHSFIKMLYKVEKINMKIDIKEIKHMQTLIEMYRKELGEANSNKRYDIYLNIIAESVPRLEEIERKIAEIGGIDYILNTMDSKEYQVKALLVEFEEDAQMQLKSVMNRYIPDIWPPEKVEKYRQISRSYNAREKIRRYVRRDQFSMSKKERGIMDIWKEGLDCREYEREYPEVKDLFYIPIFDNTVLGYSDENLLSENISFQYLNDVANGKYSLSDWISLGGFSENERPEAKIRKERMNYIQFLVWYLYKKIGLETPKEVYYLIELDEEAKISTTNLESKKYIPVGGEELYEWPNFFVSRRRWETFGDLLYIKTRQLIVKGRELKVPLDDSKMRIITEEEAEEIRRSIKQGDSTYHIEKIIEDIFRLWPETEDNKNEREKIKEKIKSQMVKKDQIYYYEPEETKCSQLYYAIIKEIDNIRKSSNYQSCHDFNDECEKIVYYLTFISHFLRTKKGFKEWYDSIEFELLLMKQIENILYKKGGSSSEFDYTSIKHGGIRLNVLHTDRTDKLIKYLGNEQIGHEVIDNRTMCDNDEVNEIILYDMARRPQKYLFVLQAPEENSIVPKETRKKIAGCAKQIKVQATEPSER